MLKFNASQFYRSVTMVRHLHVMVDERRKQKNIEEKAKVDSPSAKLITKHVKDLRKSLDSLGARVTEVACSELIEHLKLKGDSKKHIDWGTLSTVMLQVSATLRRELSLTSVFVMEPSKELYFDPKEPSFGKEFDVKFPSASFEVDEASKCFALSRNTAAVFHLMRVMEMGIRAIARCLKLPDPTKPRERNWGEILKNIKDCIDTKNSQKSWAKAADKELFESAYASLDAVRVAWRNTTMHVENKYTADEAEHILVGVRGFMKNIAARMDEQGNPQA